MKTRRSFLKNSGLLVAGTALTSPIKSFAIGNSKITNDDMVIGHGGFTYKVDKGWAQIGPSYTPLTNCHEMVQDSQGRLIMLGDNINNNVLIFDRSGKLLDSWGHGYPGGHGLSIGKDGDEDFLVLTDTGHYEDKDGKTRSQGGRVLKTDLNGRIHFAFGDPHTIGVYKKEEKFMPTETAVAPNGDIYVADGYGSDYIIQYNSQGQYIRHFGGRNNANPDHNLQTAHGVAIDQRDKNNLKLIVTSRGECCFKVFTLDGKFIERIDLPGMHVCRPVMKGKQLYSGVCWSKNEKGETNWGDSGFVTILDENNKVISNPGGSKPTYLNGELQTSINLPSPIFQHAHDVCVDNDENIYVCQWNANKTAPIKLTRV